MSFPIIEYSDEKEAFIEPSRVYKPANAPEHCVICFFSEVLKKVTKEYSGRIIVPIKWEDGPHPLCEIEYKGRRLAYFHPGIGAPLSAGLMEEVIAHGCRKFIACGSCGVLDKAIQLGHLVCVSSAVRDEGTSYHYLPPSREVGADPEVLNAIVKTMKENGVPHITGKTWTTDAPYRETKSRIEQRKAEGCVVVEMEAAAFIALSRFRNVSFGQVLYGGDDLSGAEWDQRGWHRKKEIRENLFWLCADAVLGL